MAVAYRERHGAEPLKKNREITGLLKPVFTYAPPEMEWIKSCLQPLIDKDLVEQESKRAASANGGNPGKQKRPKPSASANR